MVHCGLNKIKPAFDAQYKLTYFLYLLTQAFLVASALKILASNPSLQNRRLIELRLSALKGVKFYG